MASNINEEDLTNNELRTLLDEQNLHPFLELISNLTSSENEKRTRCEKIFDLCKTTQLGFTVKQLLRALRNPTKVQDEKARQSAEMSAVLLRRSIANREGEFTLTEANGVTSEVVSMVKTELLNALREDSMRTDTASKSITNKTRDVVIEVAAHSIDDERDEWPELLPFMFGAISGNDASDKLKETVLFIFGALSNVLGERLKPHLATLHSILQASLQHANNDVRLASLSAACSFVEGLSSTEERNAFQDLLPLMLQTLGASLQSGAEDDAQEALAMFIELAETDPRFVRKHLVDIVEAFLSIMENEEYEDGTRSLSCEFLVTLTEARDRAPGMMRKLPNFVPRLLKALLVFCFDVEDEPEWHQCGDEENDDAGNGDRFDVGSECLDRVAIALGPNAVLGHAAQMVQALLSDPDWRKRHAALHCVSQIAEGCQKGMMKDVIGSATPALHLANSDPHPRVRWAAVNCLGQLCTDLGPRLQKKGHKMVLPALMGCMDDAANPRVQAHACAATVNFTENCPPECMEPYMDDLMTKLLSLLRAGNKVVQESALTALASTADTAQETFSKYYDHVVPLLKEIIVSANTPDYRMLRAKAIECVTLVGMAVGKQRFSGDAIEVMNIMQQLQANGFDADDQTTSYMLQAWTRVCKCLGSDFIPYLSTVMPPLLQSAQLKPDVTVVNIDDADDQNEDDDEDDDLEHLEFGDKRVSIRTSILEEKSTACSMLCCYLDELKEGFLPYIQPVCEIMVPLLEFYFHEDVRRAAVASLADIIRAAKRCVEKRSGPECTLDWLKQIINYVVPPLISALGKEPEVEIQAVMLEALAECAGESGELVREFIPKMLETFEEILTESLERRAERNKRASTEDFDEEEMEALEDEQAAEDEVFDQFAECIGTLLKSFKSNILADIEPLLQSKIAPMFAPERSAEERRIAICIFDDVFEHASEGGATMKYLPGFADACVRGSADADSDVRQASVYG